MTESPKPSPEKHLLSPEQNEQIFNSDIVPIEYKAIISVPSPRVIMIGGQPGAGKSTLLENLRSTAIAEHGPNSVMQIIGDELRQYHPSWSELVKIDDAHAAFYTNIDASKWVEKARDLSQQLRPNVVLEGTLRNPEEIIDIARSYKQNNYVTELHVMAVHEFISRLYTTGRYLDQLAHKGYGRYVLKEAHDSAYQILPESIETILQAGTFDRVELHRFGGELLATYQPEQAGSDNELLEALDAERQKPALSRVEVISRLGQYAMLAQIYGKQRCLDDLNSLKQEVETQFGW